MKKSIMLMVGMLVTVMVLSLIGPAGAEKVTVTWWGKQNEPLNLEIFDSIVPDFEAAYPNIQIKRTSVGYDKIIEKTLSAVAAGVPPDMADCWSRQVPTWAEAGAIMPIDEYMSDEDWGELWPVLRKLLTYKGKAYGLPYCMNLFLLYYNKLRYRQAGLDPNSPPTTIAQLDEYSELLTELAGDGTILKAGFLPGVPGTSLASQMIVRAFGGELYKDGEVLANCPENVEAYTWAQGYADKYGVKQIEKFRAFVGRDTRVVAAGAVFSGDLAMWMDGNWQYAYGMRVAPEAQVNIAVTPFPTRAGAPKFGSITECDPFVIPTGSKHPQEALTFIKFFINNDTVMLRWADKGNTNQPSIRLWNHPMFKEGWLPHWEVYNMILSDESYNIYPHPLIPENSAYLDDLKVAFEEVMAKAKTPQAALDDLQKREEARLARYQ